MDESESDATMSRAWRWRYEDQGEAVDDYLKGKVVSSNTTYSVKHKND